MPTETLVEIRDLSRRDAKQDRLILRGVGLTIGHGERIGLVGPSGSGKSSLLRSIAKLDVCESGEVLLNGDRICEDAVPGYRRRVIYLAQRPAFVPGTVRRNLQLPFQMAASSGHFDESQVIESLDEFARPESMLEQSVDELSGGEQQIVALIRAICLSPQVLLLDEPTASLDAEATQRFERSVLRWQAGPSGDAERAFVWTSHDADQVRRMTSRQVHMRDGSLTIGGEDG